MTGREIANYIPNINAGVADVSPARRLFMPQQVLEPILLQRAREFGARFQYSTELVGYEQDDDGVTATVRNVNDGSEQQIRARYMVACDGNRSPIRESLGIKMIGHGLLSRSVTIYFRADCSEALRGRNLGVIYVIEPRRSWLLPAGEDRSRRLPRRLHRWRHQRSGRTVRRRHGHRRDGCADWFANAVGDQELEVNVLDVDKWRAVAEAAETLPGGTDLPRRRRRAHDAADWRLRRQHGHSGRPQPGLEAGDGAAEAAPDRSWSIRTTRSANRPACWPSSRRTTVT